MTRRRIAPALVARTIARVRTTRPSYVFVTPPGRLRRRLPGRRIETVGRRGKYLLLELDDGSRLVLHLGMTGQLFLAGTTSVRLLRVSARGTLPPEIQPGFRPDAHTHLRLAFTDEGPEILLRDTRKFGKILLLESGTTHPRLERLGPDALDADAAGLFGATRGRRVAIKSLLLQQSVLAGVGNIYADEALFLAGVRPTRRAGRVTRAECVRLAAALRRVFLRAIEAGGSSIRDFIAPDGSDGAYQDERRVYGRADAPCRECGAKIRRVVLAQRSTCYCPRCQR